MQLIGLMSMQPQPDTLRCGPYLSVGRLLLVTLLTIVGLFFRG